MSNNTRKDLRQELAATNDAINAVLAGGQNVMITTKAGTRQVTMANYNALIARKNELTRMLGSGVRFGRIHPV